MTLKPGARFERYAIERFVQRTRSATVYRAVDTRFDRTLLLRVFDVNRQHESEAQRAVLLADLVRASGLEHPNVVRILDVGEVDGSVFAVTDVVSGRELEDEARSASAARRLVWVLQVAQALASAHERGVVHGTLSSVMVVISTGDDSANVYGLGEASATSFAFTKALGTSDEGRGFPRLEPELTAGDPRAELADQKAWGRLAQRLLADAPVRFRSIFERAAGQTHAAEPFESLSELASVLEPELRNFVESAAITPALALPRNRIFFGLSILGVACLFIFIAGHPLKNIDSPTTTARGSTDASVHAAEPTSHRSEALGAYLAGLQAMHDASGDAGRASLDRAIALDPTFAAAYLRRVLASPSIDERVRENAQHALQFRSSLSVHDRALLDAVLPWLAIPQDTAETDRRLTLLNTSDPYDADYAYQLCRFRLLIGEYNRSNAACTTALRADPTLADAWHFKALDLVYADRIPEAFDAYSHCIEVSHVATSCLFDLNELQGVEGRCGDATKTARMMIATDPYSSVAYRMLAYSIQGDGASIEATRTALEQAWQLLSIEERRFFEPQDQAALHVLVGRLGSAARLLAEGNDATARESGEKAHLSYAQWQMAVSLESGRNDEAIRIANAFLARRAAWTPSLFIDAAIYAHVAKYRAGALSRMEFDAIRAKWLAGERARPGRGGNAFPHPGGMRWAIAYAFAAKDRSDATEALAVLPDSLPLPDAITRSPDYDEPIGNVYRLAGRFEEARAILTRATRACYAALFPIEHTRASYELGLTLEALGDHKGACSAFAVVLERWGSATPRSVTAEQARAASGRLGCGVR